jgi:DNA polymerase-3 subunit alpha
MSSSESMELERELLGMYLSDHPLLRAGEKLAKCTTAAIGELAEFPEKTKLLVGGMVGGVKPHRTRSGDTMMFFTLADLTSSVEITMFPRGYQQFAEMVQPNELIIVDATVDRRGGNGNGGDTPADTKLICERVIPLEKARPASPKKREEAERARQAALAVPAPEMDEEDAESVPEMPALGPWLEVEIRTASLQPDSLSRLQQVLQQHPGLEPVAILFADNGHKRLVELGRSIKVAPEPELHLALRALPFVIDAYEVDFLTPPT